MYVLPACIKHFQTIRNTYTPKTRYNWFIRMYIYAKCLSLNVCMRLAVSAIVTVKTIHTLNKYQYV